MKCKQCGTVNKPQAQFCCNCGTKLDTSSKNKKLYLAIIAIIVVVAIVIGSIFVFGSSSTEKQYNELMNQAQRYVEEKEYQRAEESYLEAIDIEPKKADAYVELADVYVTTDQVEKAVQLLEGAKDVVYEDEREIIEDKAEEISNQLSIDLYIEFLKAVHDNPDEYIYNQNGINSDVDESMFEKNEFGIGDVDQDGVDEIIISYTTTSMAGMHCEIWKYNDESQEFEMLPILGAGTEFYKNGFAKTPYSHNQSAGMTIWPYVVSKYDQEGYKTFGEAYCYDQEYAEAYGYKLEDDKDNDGVIYYFYLNGEQPEPLTLEEYDKLVDKYIPEDQLIDLNMQKFTIENIEKLA